jgi:hypothetical protein
LATRFEVAIPVRLAAKSQVGTGSASFWRYFAANDRIPYTIAVTQWEA